MLQQISTRVEHRGALLAILLLLALGQAAHADDKMWQDPTCVEVNQSYLKTRNYPRYSAKLPLVREDGSTKPYIEYVVTKSEMREWRAFDKKWITHPRPPPRLWDRFLPKFTECKVVGEEVTPDGPVRHYRMFWNDFPYRADTHAWISNDNGLMRRVRRHYLGSNWRFSEAAIEETFSYEDSKQSQPRQ